MSYKSRIRHNIDLKYQHLHGSIVLNESKTNSRLSTPHSCVKEEQELHFRLAIAFQKRCIKMSSSVADDASSALSDGSSSPRSRRDRLSARIKNLRSSTRNLQSTRTEDGANDHVEEILSEESCYASPTSQDPRRVDSFDSPKKNSKPVSDEELSEDGSEASDDESEDGSVSTHSDSKDEKAETPPRTLKREPETPSSRGSKARSAGSSPASSAPSSPMSRHNRVPGGAAAKLMLIGPKGSDDEEDNGDVLDPGLTINVSDLSAKHTTEEIGQIMQQTKTEFSVGSPKNRRYNDEGTETQSSNEEDTDVQSETPSFLNTSEIFHVNAAAAVAAVLAPRERPPIYCDSTSIASNQELLSAVSSGTNALSPKPSEDAGGTSPPRKGKGSGALLSDTAKSKVEKLQSQMKEPDKTLCDLLSAIVEPDDPEKVTLNYTVRRKNACGALQVLSANTNNRIPLCWTMGVLPALTSVLNNDNVQKTYPDTRHLTEFLAARERAIGALLNLSSPMANRIAMFHTPHLVPTLVSLVLQDTGSARRGCSAILAFLSKTVENRLLLAKVPDLNKAIIQVILPRAPRIAPKNPDEVEKKVYPWSEDDDDVSQNSVDRKPSHVSQGTSYTSYSGTLSSEEATPQVVASQSPVSPVQPTGYDENVDDDLRQSRQYLFAVLSHLAKEKDNVFLLCRDSTMVTSLASVAGHHESKSHALALRVLANMTRHRQNSKILVFQQRAVLPVLVRGTQSEHEDARQYR